MAMKFERKGLIIPRKHNRRCKITEADKSKVIELYAYGLPIRAIARAFKHKFSRRSIQFILFPERRERVSRIRKAKGQKYYKTEKHKEYMRRHRHWKYTLWKRGELRKRKIDDLKTMARD